MQLIDQCQFDTIYHEHHCYFSATSAARLFSSVGLHLNDVQRLPTHGGSLRIYVVRQQQPTERLESIFSEERRLGVDQVDYYRMFAQQAQQTQRKFRELVAELKQDGHSIAAYGAAAKGATLLNASRVGSELIDFVVDRNRHKHGRYMPGVHIPIRPAECLAHERPDYAVILPWNLTQEIMRQQRAYTDTGGTFIVPIPHPQIV